MNRKNRLFLIAITLITIGYFFVTSDFKKANSTIYYNATIITLEDSIPVAEAMLVDKGLVKAIGTNKEILALKTNGTLAVDLKGKTIVPGFIDSHTHVALSAFLESMIDLSGFKHKTTEEVWTYLKEQVKTKKSGTWVVGKGIDPVLVPGLTSPNLAFLDSLVPNNPLVLISQSLHTYWVNSKALEKVGIDKFTKNPSESSFYEKDSLGNLTGLIAEQKAFLPILAQLQKEVLTPKNLMNSTTKVLRNYARNGNTTVVSTGITINNAKPLRLYEFLATDTPKFINKLLATFGFLPKRKPYPRHFIYIRRDKDFLLPKKPMTGDFYNILGVKLWYDGSPYTGSMYLNAPYLNSDFCRNSLRIPENSRGKALIKKDDLKNYIVKYTLKGWQIAVHAQGDVATQEVIEAFAEAHKEIDIRNFRNRIEHCILLPESSFDKIEKLNLVPNFHINHLYYYGKALSDKIIGPERAKKILLVGEAQKRHIKYALHADQPMFESKPFRLIQTAVERQTKENDTLGFNQRISVLEGLKAMTINAAWQIHKEDKLGSLKQGKYADFVVLDKNPLAIPVHELETIKIIQTIINGNEAKK
ncbi:MAG: amidohydrolase [Flavobacteriaceae bacterium]|nr:amidohydrolase [Flavobacteriaceae bacterium]